MVNCEKAYSNNNRIGYKIARMEILFTGLTFLASEGILLYRSSSDSWSCRFGTLNSVTLVMGSVMASVYELSFSSRIVLKVFG